MLEQVKRWIAKPIIGFSRVMGIHPPPGPGIGFWSWRYLDIVRTARMVMTKRVKGFYADGERVDTRQFRGQRHFVLFTGAIT